MSTRTVEAEFDVCEVELQNTEGPALTPEQLMLIAGGQCTTNSI